MAASGVVAQCCQVHGRTADDLTAHARTRRSRLEIRFESQRSVQMKMSFVCECLQRQEADMSAFCTIS